VRLLRRRSLAAITVIAAAAVAIPLARGNADAGPDPTTCSASLASSGASMTVEDHRACVIAVATTYLGGEQGTTAPGDVILDDQVARYRLGQKPDHHAGGAGELRTAWASGHGVPAIAAPEWTVDGDDAFVAYRVLSAPDGSTTHHVAARITVRNGLVWEIVENPTTASTADQPKTTRTAFHDAAAVVGPMYPAVDMTEPDYDNPAYCTLVFGESGEASLTADQKRHCLIAIAATYVDAEGNSVADSLTIFDPRFSKYSLGDSPNHHPGNGDTNRTDQTALSPTIRLIDNKRWTADVTNDQVWITYDGYLPVSTDKPGFYVAERLTIRNGLIWEIMISPVVVDVPGSLVPSGAPKL